MNLDELLKCEKVRCVKGNVDEDLVEGETYIVEGFNDEAIKIVDRNGYSSWHNKNLFEPVLNNDIDLSVLVNHLVVGKNWKEIGCNYVVTITEISSEFADSTMVAFESDYCVSSSPLEMFLKDFTPVINDNMLKSDSEIDIIENSVNAVNNVIPTFKVGDKVYCPSMLDGIIYTVKVNSKYPGEGCKLFVINDHEDGYDFYECGSNQYNNPIVYHATEENRQALQVLHPDIEFEQPPEPLTGSDLTRVMFERGDFAVVCKCFNTGELSAKTIPLRLIVGYSNGRFEENNGNRWDCVVPFDPRTRLPLTEDVLNETI